MKFSRRTAWESEESEWAAAVESASLGRTLLDLTVSNPTRCGLGPSAEALLPVLQSPQIVQYTPDSLGLFEARSAVAAYYRSCATHVNPQRICLTTSTSEGYSFLFRLLCDPGDEVLIARPSYPLFDLLARLDDVRLREYVLLQDVGAVAGKDARWLLDLSALESAVTPRTRAVIIVHPNNPTGHYLGSSDSDALVNLCAAHGLALIVDEVFFDYHLESTGQLPRSFAGTQGCLCFVLSGLSKVCALPQMKASWIVASGPEAEVEEAMRRIEITSDTYLSMNAPVQHAFPTWLGLRAETQRMIRERMHGNLATLDRRLQNSLGNRFGVEGGWTVVLRTPRFVDDVPFELAALNSGVLVQPGHLYGLPEGRCVLSLLTEPAVWQKGLDRLPL